MKDRTIDSADLLKIEKRIPRSTIDTLWNIDIIPIEYIDGRRKELSDAEIQKTDSLFALRIRKNKKVFLKELDNMIRFLQITQDTSLLKESNLRKRFTENNL